MTAPPRISFIVPAFNEEALLGATIDALHAAGRGLNGGYEIVVADDASTDRTGEIAATRGARVVRAEHRQIAATRNAGAGAAQGAIFIFVDADTIVGPEAVRAAIAALEAGAVGGGSAVRFDGRVPVYARVLLPFCLWLYRLGRVASGCFLFCSREAFEATGGFDETLFGAEELVMSGALRRRGRFVVLREYVVTSGRKLRAYSGWEILGVLARLFSRGFRAVKQREGLDIWYGERRPDPGSGVSDSTTDRSTRGAIERVGRDPFDERDLFVLEITDPRTMPGSLPEVGSCFGVLLVWDARGVAADLIGEVAGRLLAAGAASLCAWGPDCERVHDIIDEEIVGDGTRRPVDEGREPYVMTSWHAEESLDEAAWYAIADAIPNGPANDDCRSILAVSIGAPRWAQEVRAAFADTEALWSRLDEAEGD